MLTIEERERLAYVSGRVEDAAVMGEAMDAVDDRIDELEYDNESLRTEVKDLEQMINGLEENGR